ncbi:MAG TPA: cytochrome c [Hypericibacter adhaerens]|jgi:cytochrome c556|uniref:Cytochrome C556 n=1 Tax=Hypericibacter adhaerens TaxID=2602016 RepID=A0A5J6MYZ0_9PROT|nr:cytochrome c [Hypericibacter adhaerens]QEX22173.1 cytochrome C556 [Hypericibacter adhaerens]HWA46463.1 cytochrome c [Hypericibacter adhaerens]
MSWKSWIAFSAVCALAVGIAASHSNRSAADTPVVQQRQALMKEMGKQMGIINDFLQKGAGDAAGAQAAADTIHADAAKIPDLFPQGTSINDNVGKTGAKPEIWANFDSFKAAAAKLAELSATASTAAAGGDKAALGDAFGAMGKNGCGGCHQNFRQKID